MNERVGTAQRTHVLDLLSKALEEGYLDLAEFEQRMNIVTSAKMVHELQGPLADLPPRFHWDPRALPPAPIAAPMSSPVVRHDSNAQPTAVASLVLGIASIPLAICFGMGFLFGIAAVVLSRPGLRSVSERGKAMTGLVLGCVGICASIAMVLLLMFAPTTPTTR